MQKLVRERLEKYESPGRVFERNINANQPSCVARLALNFKGLSYKTKWIPYIRLQETLKSLYVLPLRCLRHKVIKLQYIPRFQNLRRNQ